MTSVITRVKIRYEQDVVYARQRARRIAELLGYDVTDQTRLGTAVSEIARNAYQYAENADVEFAVEDASPGKTFMITIRDRGPGILDLQSILEGRYTSSTGMGRGIVGTRRLMDHFHIATTPGQGTTVVLGKTLPPDAPEFTPAVLLNIADELSVSGVGSPLEEIRVQNQELLRTLDELQHQRKELEDTNRGVLALYTELDEKVAQLRSIDNLKTHFLSNISHEFRTPLNSIAALSRILLSKTDGSLTPDQETQVIFISQAAHDLTALVNDLLDIAKIDAGKVIVNAHECRVEEIFSGLRGMLKPLLEGTPVELIIESAEEFPPLFTDDGKVAQILRNFASNALKFTYAGIVRVSARMSDDKHMMLFSVSDTGIGITAENLERIFDEYVQVETAQQGRAKGTGLGLPISRKLAILLGGHVEVESRTGEGSTFTAAIPMRYAAADTTDTHTTPSPSVDYAPRTSS